MNKIEARGLNLEPGDKVDVPGILELPLTLECKVLFRNVQDQSRLPEPIRSRFYTGGNNADYHIAYYGEILGAYIAE
jgi:flavin reductase (DIM6/NTAB) family NADH-FMN oxidoreductase RutF